MHPVEGGRNTLTSGEDPTHQKAKQDRTVSKVISHEIKGAADLPGEALARSNLQIID
jgi:hypothetical protein